jgi:hypothetical protein
MKASSRSVLNTHAHAPLFAVRRGGHFVLAMNTKSAGLQSIKLCGRVFRVL